MRVSPLRRLLLLVPVSFACAQIPEPDAAGKTALIERMRAAALHYADELKDFTCTEFMTRSADGSGTGNRYKLLENQELELGYLAHKENYKLLSVNGKTTNLEKRVKQGYFKPGGEFGTALQKIFDPKANAEFAWDRVEQNGEKTSCVFRYNVPLATTTMALRVNLQIVKLGHHGFVYADCNTGAVTRFQTESDVPTITEQHHQIQVGTGIDVRYGPVVIDSKEFLLPLEVVEVNRFYKTLTKAEIRFEQYRKYDSNSTITFEPAK